MFLAQTVPTMAKNREICNIISSLKCLFTYMGRHGRDRMVVGFTTAYAISAYHH